MKHNANELPFLDRLCLACLKAAFSCAEFYDRPLSQVEYRLYLSVGRLSCAEASQILVLRFNHFNPIFKQKSGKINLEKFDPLVLTIS